MEAKFRNLQQAYDDLKGFNTDLDEMDAKGYFSYKDSIHEAMDLCTSIPKDLHRISDELDNYETRRPDLVAKKNQKDKVIQKLNRFEDDIKELVRRVKKQEERFANENPEDYGVGGERPERHDSFGGQMKLLTLEKNSEILEKRRKDLEEIKQTSAQVNQLSEVMKQEVYEQGEMLNDIESNVNKADSNINKAQEQIKEADKLQQQGRKKTLWLIGIVLGVVIVIVAIIVCIFVGKKK